MRFVTENCVHGYDSACPAANGRMSGWLRCLVFAFAPAVMLLTPHNLNAQTSRQDCTNLLLNHSYIQALEGGVLNVPMYFKSLGVAPPPSVGIVPTAGLALMSFLPNGKVSGRLTLGVGLSGLFQDLPFDADQSNYSITVDNAAIPAVCSGTLTVVTPAGADHFQLLVSQDGRRIETIHTDTGLAVSLTGFQVEASGCSNATAGGKYLYNMRGWALAGGPMDFPSEQKLAGHFPMAFSGAMEFHPSAFPRPADPGTVMAWDSLSVNGIIMPRTATGAYSIKPDCTGILTLTDSTGEGFHLELFVDKRTGTLYMVNVDMVPGTAIPLFLLGATMTRVDQE